MHLKLGVTQILSNKFDNDITKDERSDVQLEMEKQPTMYNIVITGNRNEKYYCHDCQYTFGLLRAKAL